MADKALIIKTGLKIEGYESDYAWDPGGLTRWGLTRADIIEANYPKKLEDITLAEAEEILGLLYFDRQGLGLIHNHVHAQMIYCCGLNQGKMTSIMMAQRALARLTTKPVKLDGTLGPITAALINALDGADIENFIDEYNTERINRYNLLHDTNQDFRENGVLKGWLRNVGMACGRRND